MDVLPRASVGSTIVQCIVQQENIWCFTFTSPCRNFTTFNQASRKGYRNITEKLKRKRIQ
jgi:hypothetical protein